MLAGRVSVRTCVAGATGAGWLEPPVVLTWVLVWVVVLWPDAPLAAEPVMALAAVWAAVFWPVAVLAVLLVAVWAEPVLVFTVDCITELPVTLPAAPVASCTVALVVAAGWFSVTEV